MNFAVCSAITLLVVFAPLSESGFIKKLVLGAIGGNQNTGKVESEQNFRGNNNSQYSQQSEHTTQTYKNTSWHIENEDYLTPNANESSQHKQQRPNSQYGGGGTYDKKSSTSRPYRNTTFDIIHEEYLTPNANESSQHKQRPSSQYGGGGTYDKKTTTTRPLGNTNSHFVHERPSGQLDSVGTYDLNPSNTSHFYNNHEESSHHNNGHGTDERTHATFQDFPPTNTHSLARQAIQNADGNIVILKSDTVTCQYSNVKDKQTENRRLRCNDTECRLEKTSEKSSLWICDDYVKCTIANVDFSEDHGQKKLMECTMDGRNIITVQEKPIKCKPNEKVHKGVCREVFGA